MIFIAFPFFLSQPRQPQSLYIYVLPRSFLRPERECWANRAFIIYFESHSLIWYWLFDAEIQLRSGYQFSARAIKSWRVCKKISNVADWPMRSSGQISLVGSVDIYNLPNGWYGGAPQSRSACNWVGCFDSRPVGIEQACPGLYLGMDWYKANALGGKSRYLMSFPKDTRGDWYHPVSHFIV